MMGFSTMLRAMIAGPAAGWSRAPAPTSASTPST
jgi:hypothetical protein